MTLFPCRPTQAGPALNAQSPIIARFQRLLPLNLLFRISTLRFERHGRLINLPEDLVGYASFFLAPVLRAIFEWLCDSRPGALPAPPSRERKAAPCSVDNQECREQWPG